MIREFQKSDIERLADIWLDTNLNAHNFIPSQYWLSKFETVKEMFLLAEIYVCEKENEVQGFIGLYENYIAGIFVQSQFQTKGIGKQLLDFVKDRKEELSLSVYQKNIRAVKFYKRENFEIRCENKDEDTCEKEYLMVWSRKKLSVLQRV